MNKINNKVKALIWVSLFAVPQLLPYLIGALWAVFNMEKVHELKQVGEVALNNHIVAVFEPWIPFFTIIESVSWIAVAYVFVKLWKK